MDQPNETPRLRETGQVYVTLAAATEYARAARDAYAGSPELRIEEARRELTELVLEARRVQGDTETPERWRFRRQSIGVDLSVRIVRERSQYSEATLAVVVSITARSYSRAPRR